MVDAAPEEAGAPRPERPYWPAKGSLERTAWIALLLLSAALRLFQLGSRPLHHDESIHAWFSWNLSRTGEYKYDPVYHGPVQYAAVATTFRLLGDSDFTARLPAALGGVALVALALFLRPRFGKGPAFAAGVLASLSPNLLFYTRFCREDVWSLLGTAGAFLFLDAWWRGKSGSPGAAEPAPGASEASISSSSTGLRWLVYAALATSVAFASKENFYVLLALLVPSVVAVFLEPDEGLVFWPRVKRLVEFLERNAVAIGGALFLFFVVSELLYTVFLVHPDSGNPALQAISYWWGQHKVERVGGPKTYYLPRLLQYEFAILLPAFWWIVRGWRLSDFRTLLSRPVLAASRLFRGLSPVERFLAAWGVSSLAMYAYLGEKTPWLLVHQILPFVPLAGLAWARIVKGSVAARVFGGVVAAASVVSAVVLSFVYSDLTPNRNKAESVIYVTTSPEVLDVVRDTKIANGRGADPAAIVDGEGAWPLSWYLRHERVGWSFAKDGPRAPVIVVDDKRAAEVGAILGPEWEGREIPLRSWWVPETSLSPLRPSPKELLRYLFTRTPWPDEGGVTIGAQRVHVFRRKDLPRR